MVHALQDLDDFPVITMQVPKGGDEASNFPYSSFSGVT